MTNNVCKNCLHFDEVLSGHTVPRIIAFACLHLSRDVRVSAPACKYYLGKDLLLADYILADKKRIGAMAEEIYGREEQ